MNASLVMITIALLFIAMVATWTFLQRRRVRRRVEASQAKQALVLALQEALNALMDDSSLGVDELEQRTASVLAEMEALNELGGLTLTPLIEDNRAFIAAEFARRRAREAGSRSGG